MVVILRNIFYLYMLGGEEPEGKNISDAHYSGSKVTRPKKKLKK